MVEIPHAAVRALRFAAGGRDTTVPRLVRDLIEAVAADNLIAAVLDDLRWLRSGRRVRVVAGDKVRLEMRPYVAPRCHQLLLQVPEPDRAHAGSPIRNLEHQA